jgi:hypothetical protein
MGRHLGIKASEDLYIWEVASMAAIKPLPNNWQELMDKKGHTISFRYAGIFMEFNEGLGFRV